MLKESGKVVSIEDDGLWVETIQQSTCGSCRAKKGCGQQLLSKIGVHSANIKAVFDKNDKKLFIFSFVLLRNYSYFYYIYTSIFFTSENSFIWRKNYGVLDIFLFKNFSINKNSH